MVVGPNKGFIKMWSNSLSQSHREGEKTFIFCGRNERNKEMEQETIPWFGMTRKLTWLQLVLATAQ